MEPGLGLQKHPEQSPPGIAKARAGLWFLAIPDTFRSSGATVWFSPMSLLLSLWRCSNRWSATVAWALAKRSLAFCLL